MERKQKLSQKELAKLASQLSPFLEKYWEISSEFSENIGKLVEQMNEKIKPPTKLEFFHVDGECVGIGAENYQDREWFPLIKDKELIKSPK
jgi:hypothetical protein